MDPSTVLVNFKDAVAVSNNSGFGWNIGAQGTIVPSRVVGEGSLLVVENLPYAVAFVNFRTLPQLFIKVHEVCDVAITPLMEASVAVWGTAPITKVDLRKEA